MSDPIRVLLADKEQLIHDTVRMAIDKDEQLIPIGELIHETDLRAICPKLQPDILLLATNLSERPRDLLETLHRHYPKLKILVLFSHPNEVNIELGNNERISGAFLKFDPPERLIHAIHTVVSRQPLV